MDMLIISGTIVAIAGDDFAVIAADSQICRNNESVTNRRDQLFQLSPVAVMSCAGSWPDTLALNRWMTTAVSDYKMTNLRPISIDVMSRKLSKAMYERRFLPYCVSTIMAGIDQAGKGAVFSLDSLGHCERVKYQATGTATAMVLPLLDSILESKNQSQAAATKKIELTEAVSIVSNCMDIASQLGDSSGVAGFMKIIKKDGIKVIQLPLRQK